MWPGFIHGTQIPIQENTTILIAFQDAALFLCLLGIIP
jgi:hypothetical protein